MIWDEWRGSNDGRPTLWVRHLLSAFGCKVDLHKMVRGDDQECFHTHPAYALRVILWGGYVEELESGRWRTWWPGMIGLIAPSYAHRIGGLRNGRASYSLWLRFRKRAKVKLTGDGWAAQEQTFRDPNTVLDH